MQDDYRKYSNEGKISQFYLKNHTNQTLDFVLEKKEKILKLKNYKMPLIKVIKLLDEIIDDSDPDTNNTQIIHAIQAGEMAKQLYPELDWLHLVAFIHDVGKILAHPKLFNQEQWCTVGDTFPVGCKFNDKIIYYEHFKENPDNQNSKYNSLLGIYKENIGFDNIHFSWSHDEYLYQVCKQNKCQIPKEGLYIIRYHSFYPWHQYEAYNYLASEYDKNMLTYLKMFQKCDLYSKKEEDIKIDEKLIYYEKLIDKYFPNRILNW